MLVNIIGCGKVGKTLGRLIHQKKIATIQNIVTTNKWSAQNARNFIGAGTICLDINKLKPADIYFIATPDHSIAITLSHLLTNPKLKANAIIVHFSGALASEVLAAAHRRHCYIASVHPIKGFADPDKSAGTFASTYCAVEGDAKALKKLRPFFTKLGGKVFSINAAKKALYHAATVFSSNYLVTLGFIADSLLRESGISKKLTKEILIHLMQATIDNLKSLSPQAALTGPLQRGDMTTVRKHLNALKNSDFSAVYQELAKTTLLMTNHKDKIN